MESFDPDEELCRFRHQQMLRRQLEGLLHSAARRGDMALLQCVVALGVDVNAPTRDGSFALHLACAAGHRAVVDLLLFYGARWDAGARPPPVRGNSRKLVARGGVQASAWRRGCGDSLGPGSYALENLSSQPVSASQRPPRSALLAVVEMLSRSSTQK
eukprot:gnl/Hemi2/9318_TR3249_c0_g1_i1.p2 gnl/Hemi2/9318_TR3249_c0_g1~~gnl/Hemi2/9318_TR3249_c0_g1_i1.p2  ORF type:complete len:158 (-),score=23.83 gnl/Hemi2/9318_TR3249_c0_g1_i1:101-574(-)